MGISNVGVMIITPIFFCMKSVKKKRPDPAPPFSIQPDD